MARRAWAVFGGAIAGLFVTLATRAADDDAVVVIDAANKEVRISGVTFSAGAKRLAWLADPQGETLDAKRGPVALEFRETHSTTYQKGISTFIPAASVGAVRYEYDKQTVSVTVKGLKEPLVGTTQYKGINVVGFDGDVIGGKTEKFSGGASSKSGYKSVTFPDPKPLAARPASDSRWTIQIVQPTANNPTLTVRNLKPLYQFAGGVEQLADSIPIRKGPPLKFDASLKSVEVIAVDQNTNMVAVEVTPRDGPEKMVAFSQVVEFDKRQATLVGLLGEVDAGWKLFPLHTIKVMTAARVD